MLDDAATVVGILLPKILRRQTSNRQSVIPKLGGRLKESFRLHPQLEFVISTGIEFDFGDFQLFLVGVDGDEINFVDVVFIPPAAHVVPTVVAAVVGDEPALETLT